MTIVQIFKNTNNGGINFVSKTLVMPWSYMGDRTKNGVHVKHFGNQGNINVLLFKMSMICRGDLCKWPLMYYFSDCFTDTSSCTEVQDMENLSYYGHTLLLAQMFLAFSRRPNDTTFVCSWTDLIKFSAAMPKYKLVTINSLQSCLICVSHTTLWHLKIRKKHTNFKDQQEIHYYLPLSLEQEITRKQIYQSFWIAKMHFQVNYFWKINFYG